MTVVLPGRSATLPPGTEACRIGSLHPCPSTVTRWSPGWSTLARSAGFVVEDLDQRYGVGPKAWSYLTRAATVRA